MKIKYPFLFQDDIKEAKLVQIPSLITRETTFVIEIIGMPVQIQAPAEDCIVIKANMEEKRILKESFYEVQFED